MSSYFVERVAGAIESARDSKFAGMNIFSYQHGTSWSVKAPHSSPETNDFKLTNAEAIVKFNDVLNHDILVVKRAQDSIVGAMMKSFTEGVRTMLEDTTSKTGNLVKYTGDFAADILLAFEKMKIGCDEYGRPTMPQLLRVDMATPIEMGEVFTGEKLQEFQILQQAKELEAIAEEAARIARFRWVP